MYIQTKNRDSPLGCRNPIEKTSPPGTLKNHSDEPEPPWGHSSKHGTSGRDQTSSPASSRNRRLPSGTNGSGGSSLSSVESSPHWLMVKLKGLGTNYLDKAVCD